MRNMLQPRPLCSLLWLLLLAPSLRAERVCSSVEVRSPQDLVRLRDCRIVVGHVRILLLDLGALPPNAKVSSAVEEISDYLLVYRVQGVATLRRIFPRLKLVRGRELLYERYALTVHENRDLQELGLERLVRVQRGAIRVEANPQLCYVDTVNWVQLLGNCSVQHFTLKHNKLPNHCPLCRLPEESNALAALDDADEEEDENFNTSGHCWAYELPQRLLSSACGACLSRCGDVADCELCAELRLNRRCMKQCPATFYELNKRDCVQATVCLQRGLIPHAGACVHSCPPHYQQLNNVTQPQQQISCVPICAGNYVLQTTDDLDALQDCTVLSGTLTIELREFKMKIVEQLEKALAKLHEITGYLRIKRSPQLVSLSFLRNLNTIGGTKLIDSKYAIYIVDNVHLEQLWAPQQTVAVLKGHVYFHLNPRLCYEKILQLEHSLRSGEKISIVDASPNSNGERVICGNAVRIINATIEDLSATAALVKVDHFSAEDKDVLIGYLHHYKEAPHLNVTMYDGRHGCGHDNWLMDISPSINIRHKILNLKPYTHYAYFVKTITMTDYHRQMTAYSEIQYFRTLASRPGPVAKVYFNALTASKILVHWWPPRNPNGNISSYLIAHKKIANPGLNDTAKKYTNPTPKNHEDNNKCDCHAVDPFWSGPLPADENYYSKEQIVYDEALPNLIYFSRSTDDQYTTSETPTTTAAPTTTTSAVESSIMIAPRPTAVPNPAQNEIAGVLPSDIDATKPKDDEGENGLEKFHKELESKARAEQDTGKKDFLISTESQPLCADPNASAQFRAENKCVQPEKYAGEELPGHMHAYKLTELDPAATYRISVRACVKQKGCSAEAVIFAKTLSKKMEQFLNDLRQSSN